MAIRVLMTLVIALMGICDMCVASTYPATLEDALSALDKAIKCRDEYITAKQTEVNALKSRLQIAKGDEKLVLYEKLGDEYQRLNIDSAVYYYNQGLLCATDAADAKRAQRFEILKASILPVQGVVKEALEVYEAITSADLYEDNRAIYYEAGNRLYFFLSSFYPINELRRDFAKCGVHLTDTLLSSCNLPEAKTKLYNAQLCFFNGQAPLAVADLNDILDTTPIKDNLFARAASVLASIYEQTDNDKYIYYLALAAIADIHSSTLEGSALQRLGVALYKMGDIDRAYTCLTLSLDNAVASGARMRALESAESIPLIAQTFKQRDEAKHRWLLLLFVAFVVALVVIVGVVIFLRREMKKLSMLKSRLAEANLMKETNISRFLSLSSIYIEKLEEFQRMAARKIKAGQVTDLYTTITSGKMLQEQSEMFYEVFDNAFIHIYPTFIDDVNNLLRENSKIVTYNQGRLSTELRILAFMRLGIDDSSQISRFLGLSLTTIYTYRNKLKSKAINRDTFEHEVMKIGKITV